MNFNKNNYHEMPGLQALESNLSEDTLALNSSSSNEFEDENLCEKVDLITTTLGKVPPSIPLREERMSLGIECVFKAKGVGWSGVKKIGKKSVSPDQGKDTSGSIYYKPLLTCCTDISPTQEDERTPKYSNTKENVLKKRSLKALSYPEYVDYLLRCRAKKKEYIEHPYLELERSNDTDDVSKKRIYTRLLESRQETFDSAVVGDCLSSGVVREDEIRQNPSISSDILAQYCPTDESSASNTAKSKSERQSSPSELCTKKSKSVSFAVLEQQHLKRTGMRTSLPTIFDDEMESSVGCCKYDGMLEETATPLGRNSADIDSTMPCMGVSDSTIPTTEYFLFDIETMDKRQGKEEAKVLRDSRSSSIMDSVDQTGDVGVKESMCTVDTFHVRHDRSIENLDDCRDDIRERFLSDDEREKIPVESQDIISDLSSNIPTENEFFTFISTPREHRFSFYYPGNETEEDTSESTNDISIQTSFTKCDSDATPLISNSGKLQCKFQSSFNKSNRDNSPVSKQERKLDHVAESHSDIGCSFSQEQKLEPPPIDLACDSDLADENNRTTYCDSDLKFSSYSANVDITLRTIMKNNVGHHSKKYSDVGSATSFEFNSKSSPIQVASDQTPVKDDGMRKCSSLLTTYNMISNQEVMSDELVKFDPKQVYSAYSDIGCNTSYNSKSTSILIESASEVSRTENIQTVQQSCSSLKSSPIQRDNSILTERIGNNFDCSVKSYSHIGCNTSFENESGAFGNQDVPPPVIQQTTQRSCYLTSSNQKSEDKMVIEPIQDKLQSSPNSFSSAASLELLSTKLPSNKSSGFETARPVPYESMLLSPDSSKNSFNIPIEYISRSSGSPNTHDEQDTSNIDQHNQASQFSSQDDNRSNEGCNNELPHDSYFLSMLSMRLDENIVDSRDEANFVASDYCTVVSAGEDIRRFSCKSRDDSARELAPKLASKGMKSIMQSDNDTSHMVNGSFIYDSSPTEYPAYNDTNFDYTIPNSLSLLSCHSSLYSDEMSTTTSFGKDMGSCIHNTSIMRSFGSHQQDSWSSTRSLPKSFSSTASYHSANTSLSKTSCVMSQEEIERCISYTLSELGRINSMLDEMNVQTNLESMSCTSESTEGRDALYYARQSKNEIAALHNLIEYHINKEKDRNCELLGNTFYVSGSGSLASNSFETMMSAKSQPSIVESPSIDRLILDVSKLCTEIECRIENIVKDSGND
jgi:hypothetical protein